MKKLLGLLSLLAVGTTTITNVVACSSHPDDKKNDQSNLPFLYHVTTNTNLGQIPGNEKSILQAFKAKNPKIDTAGFKVTNIASEENASSSATINVDKDNPNYRAGTLNVTFNISNSKNLSDLITVRNIYANRNIGLLPTPTKITIKDVLEGLNAMNGLNLTTDEVEVQGVETGNPLPKEATIVAKAGSIYTGEPVKLLLNQQVDVSKIFTNNTIGNLPLPVEMINNFDQEDYQLVIMAFMMETIGDANPVIQYYSDFLANLQGSDQLANILIISKNSLTMNANYELNNPLHGPLTGQVTFNFNLVTDQRVTTKQVITTRNLGMLKDDSYETIKKAIIEKNQQSLSKYNSDEVDSYLLINNPENEPFKPDGSQTKEVTWLPGSKIFLGHNPIAAGLATSMGIKIPELNVKIEFTTQQ